MSTCSTFGKREKLTCCCGDSAEWVFAQARLQAGMRNARVKTCLAGTRAPSQKRPESLAAQSNCGVGKGVGEGPEGLEKGRLARISAALLRSVETLLRASKRCLKISQELRRLFLDYLAQPRTALARFPSPRWVTSLAGR